MSDDPVIRALYSPSQRNVACVIIQAMYDGDRRACHAFEGWCVDIQDDFRMISAPLSQWQAIGRMKPEDRPGPENFANQGGLRG